MIFPIDKYVSLPTIPNQPYSFSPDDYRGKEADLGPRIYSPLYMGQPISGADRMFAPEAWGIVETITTSEYSLLITAWDTASRTKATNDPSCNVTVGRRWAGDFVVLDCFEGRFTMDRLLPVVLERYRVTCGQFAATPTYLCVEEADSGKGLIDIIEAQWPMLPLLKAKAVKSKIIRAESVTPFTSAGSVKLLRADWNTQFIADLGNFPASDRDHSVDAFVHSIRGFVGTGSDFQTPNLLPGQVAPMSEADEVTALLAAANSGDYGPEYKSSFSEDNAFDRSMDDLGKRGGKWGF
jgi:predicted phage terminase large subunit-like protein